jgi:hypothetical protein
MQIARSGALLLHTFWYTDTIRKQQLERSRNGLETLIESDTTHTKLYGCHSHHNSASIDVDLVLQKFTYLNNANMEINSCEEALNCVLANYEVSLSFISLQIRQMAYTYQV